MNGGRDDGNDVCGDGCGCGDVCGYGITNSSGGNGVTADGDGVSAELRNDLANFCNQTVWKMFFLSEKSLCERKSLRWREG